MSAAIPNVDEVRSKPSVIGLVCVSFTGLTGLGTDGSMIGWSVIPVLAAVADFRLVFGTRRARIVIETDRGVRGGRKAARRLRDERDPSVGDRRHHDRSGRR
jgi:hypothetical protein